MRKLLFATLLFSLFFAESNAQYFFFGKNKVQYKNFEWYSLQSEHFDVYYSEGGDYLARFTADALESAYFTIRKDFKYEITNRIALIVFNSQTDFQQNNVIQEYLSEGVGGVTELYKNRIVVPFTGDYKQFRHVIHHELIHAVVNDMIYGGSIQSAIRNNVQLQIPLWFNEGIAEYQPLEWDTNSDMFITDAIINNYLPPIPYLSGYFAYRGGQSVWRYVSQKYGREKIGEIMGRLRASRSIDVAFKGSLGLNVEELSERWLREMKVTYWPEIAKREDINTIMKRLTDHRKDGSNYNTSPAISPQGDRFAFITDRSGYFDIYVGSTVNPEQAKRVISGQRSRDFEELKILTPGLTWSPDGKKIALATKAGGEDAIMVIDVETEEIEKYTFNMNGIYSVDWSPDGGRLAFIGLYNYKSDVYVYDFNSKQITNLTNDIYSDSDPQWSPDGKKIYFSSDRQDSLKTSPYTFIQGDPIPDIDYVIPALNEDMRVHDYSQLDLYELIFDQNSNFRGSLKRLTATKGIDETSPVLSPDGKKMLFVSDLNGVLNVYELELATVEKAPLINTDRSTTIPKIRPVTNLLTGIRQISMSSDGSKLIAVGLDYGGFDIYLLRMPFDRQLNFLTAEGFLEPTNWGGKMVASQTKRFTEVTSAMRQMIGNGSYRVPIASPAKEDSAKAIARAAAIEDSSKRVYSAPKVNVKNFVFDRGFMAQAERKIQQDTAKDQLTIEDENRRRRNNIDEGGEYRPRRYKLNFSPDIIYGGAGIDGIWGAQGSALFAFSDLLGDHQLSIFTNLQFDLQNSNYGLQYAYLGNRMDYAVNLYHTARFLVLGQDAFSSSLFRFRTYGAEFNVSYPIDRLNRIDAGLSYLWLTKENTQENIGNDTRNILYPSLTYTHDDTRPFLYSPIDGTRYAVRLSGTALSGISFGSILADYRTYFNFWQYYSFVVRFSGAYSIGSNPQKFFIGGTENWINRQFSQQVIPISEVQDFLFTTPAIPLRGHPLNAANGTKFALANLELRFPFLQYLALGPIPIPFYYLQGVLFADVGSAWTNTEAWKISSNGRLQDLLAGFGWGFRTVLFYFILRFDMAWKWDLNGTSMPVYHISIGGDF
ncbi:MAG: hypothetical protein SFU91_12165 [Chloroherpetonaceae bacterium]|nr:hypothetical protein [Chloroherpetonaceae bacterium]